MNATRWNKDERRNEPPDQKVTNFSGHEHRARLIVSARENWNFRLRNSPKRWIGRFAINSSFFHSIIGKVILCDVQKVEENLKFGSFFVWRFQRAISYDVRVRARYSIEQLNYSTIHFKFSDIWLERLEMGIVIKECCCLQILINVKDINKIFESPLFFILTLIWNLSTSNETYRNKFIVMEKIIIVTIILLLYEINQHKINLQHWRL